MQLLISVDKIVFVLYAPSMEVSMTLIGACAVLSKIGGVLYVAEKAVLAVVAALKGGGSDGAA